MLRATGVAPRCASSGVKLRTVTRSTLVARRHVQEPKGLGCSPPPPVPVRRLDALVDRAERR
ncbi:MAG TPA: hypothetical protein VFB42_08050 [Gaiellaceae bacterium]|nr:hypothetical protein [Gaiellaceae bacterium]